MSTRKLRPYQVLAAEQVRKNRATALFMEMRLGKTLSVIRGLGKASGKYLVISPMSGLWAWKRELGLEGLPERYTVTLVGSRKQRLTALKCAGPWFLINYEGVLACPEVLEEDWDAVILDESRRIANPKAKTTKLLQQWSRKTPHCKRIILSGNPAPESPMEYFEQMRFLYGRFMGCENYWQFRNYYFRELAPHEWVPKPGCVQTIKQEVHNHAFILTRKQAGIDSVKIYERRVVKLGPEARKTYEKAKSDFLLEWKGKELKSTLWIPVQYTWLQQIASGFADGKLIDRAKISELTDLLEGELNGQSVVVWFRFNAGLFAVSSALQKRGITYRKITGDVSVGDREKAINGFRNGTFRVLLCQIKCAREAIDLSTSSTAVYFSNSHSLDDRSQSEDRILNPAKKDPLLYLDLVAEDTVDEHVVDLLKDKKLESRFFLSTLLQKLRRSA